MRMNRRAMLAGGCAALAYSPASSQSPPRVIDVHTHVFNASDLSVEKFVSVVVCKNYSEATSNCPPGEPYGPALGRVVKRIANAFAPSASSELRALNRGAADAGLPTPEDEKLNLADSEQRDTESENAWRDALAAELNDTRGSNADDPFSSSQSLMREVDAEVARLRPGGDAGLRTDREKVDDLMSARSDGKVGRYLKWARWMCRSRRRILKQYNDVYDDHAIITKHVGLLVDYELWLGEAPESSFASQMDVMAKLRERYPALLSFAPFDPLRQAFAMQDRVRTPLEDLQARWRRTPNCPTTPERQNPRRSIDGVKLYPPMGFRPIDNAELPDEAFPAHVVRAWRAKGGAAGRLGAALDRALQEFYRWAVWEDVPILTHSGNSVDAGCGFATRGEPRQWMKVLSRDVRMSDGRRGLGHERLRLCLGHFDNPTDFTNNDPGSWGRQKGPLIDFPNVYTDLSYMEEIVNPANAAQVSAFFQALKGFSAENNRGRKILFGSDWIMFDREANKELYFENIRTQFQAAQFPTGALEDFASGNARRYLELCDG